MRVLGLSLTSIRMNEVFSNLPAFTKVGAPMLCITLKLYGFKVSRVVAVFGWK